MITINITQEMLESLGVGLIDSDLLEAIPALFVVLFELVLQNHPVDTVEELLMDRLTNQPESLQLTEYQREIVRKFITSLLDGVRDAATTSSG